MGNRLLRLLAGSLCALLLGSGSALAADRPVLRVGIGPLAPGYVVQDSAGIYYGKDTDYMIALASYAGYDVQFVSGTWAECLAWIENGDIDVLAGVIARPEYRGILDYSKLPTGMSYSSIWVQGGSQRLDDIAASGRHPRIGTIAVGYTPFVQLYMRNHFAGVDLLPYPTYEAMGQASEDGAIDGIVRDMLLDSDEPGRVATFDMKQEYFAVRHGNEAMREKLDLAADQMMVNRPLFKAQLFAQYHLQENLPLLLDNSEKEYLRLRQGTPVRAVVVARARPYAYVDSDGEVAGTVRQIADRMEDDLGISFSYIAARDYDEAYGLIARGEADVLLNSSVDYANLSAYGMDATASYMTMYYTTVTRRGALPDDPLAATFSGYVSRHMLSELYPGERTQMFATPEDCLQAVRDGKADLTYVPQEVADYAIMSGDYPELVQEGIVLTYPLGMGIAKTADAHLLSIFDKEIQHIGVQAVRDIALQHAQQTSSSRSLKSILYAYPQRFVLGLIIFGTILALLAWRLFYQRQRHFVETQQLLYLDTNIPRHNRRWFYEQSCELLRHVKPEEAAAMSVVIFSIQRLEALQATYGNEAVFEMFGLIADKLDAERDWIELHALSTSNGRLSALTKAMEPEALADYIHKFLKEHEYIHIANMAVHVPIAVGVCFLTETGGDVSQAATNAAIAARVAAPVQFFDRQLQEKEQLHNRMESAQQSALENKEFAVWYQPKYDLTTRKCVGAEALVRWTSPTLGFLSPGEFISLFESNGFITQLDFYMLEHVMAFQKEREQQGLPIVQISVNQSRLHMREQGYLHHMRQLVRDYGIKGEVALELLESAFDFVSDEQREHALAVVTALKGLGFAIDMDDFGSGYSDLSLLNYLPLDAMKLDRSMLLASEGSERMLKVLEHMIHLGHVLDLKVVCEGIETPEQEEMLRGFHCDYGQGYYYSKPLPEAEFTEFLATHI